MGDCFRLTGSLTTATDSITGTSGNDIIIGDVGTTVTVQGSDQVAGGAGTDTYKIFGAFTAGTSETGTVTGVENLYIAKVAHADQVFTSLAKSATGIEKIEIADASLLTADTITTTAGQSLSLASGVANLKTAGGVTWAASATDTAASLILNGYQGKDTNANAQDVTITGTATTTQNIASTGAANKVGTLSLTAATTKAVITGDQALTVTTSLLATGSATVLKTVDASAAKGNVSIAIAAATNAAFSFTGGSGNDAINFTTADTLKALTSGAQLDGGAGTCQRSPQWSHLMIGV